MSAKRAFDEQVSAWLIEEAPAQLPDRVLRATFERTMAMSQHRRLLPLRRMPRLLRQRWLLVAVGLLAILAGGLLAIASRPQRPELLGQAGLIAYDKDWHIYTETAEGQGHAQVTTGTNDFSPQWSPDGSTLAFYRSPDRTLRGLSIWVIRVNRPEPVKVSGNVSIDIDDGWRIAWSPSSSEIAFASKVGISSILYVADAGGAGVREIADRTRFPVAPAWSPDGTAIAFRRGLYEGDVGISLVSPDGSNIRKLTTTQLHLDAEVNRYTAPVWSPDGSKLAFYAGLSGSQDIWVVNRDGSDEHPLMKTAYPLDEIWPAWSPDGSKIAYLRLDHKVSSGTVFVMNADGTAAHAISPPTADGTLEWSSDEARVLARLCPTTEPDCARDDVWNIVALDPAGTLEPQLLNADSGIGGLTWQRLPP